MRVQVARLELKKAANPRNFCKQKCYQEGLRPCLPLYQPSYQEVWQYLPNLQVIILLLVTFSLGAKPTLAPKFSLPNTSARYYSLTKMLKTSPVIISFWASYCSPCEKEIADLNSKDFKIPIFFINIDPPSNQKAALQKIKQWNIPETILFDYYQLTIKKYSAKFRLPATFLIDQKRRIIFSYQRYDREKINELESKVKELH